MFGMLSPAQHSLAYRTCYARCCQHHRRVHGVSALPWLSYESVLLYQVAADAGVFHPADLPAVRCCKLLPLSSRIDDREVGTFCAHVGSLLASIKLSDDVRDGGSLKARMLAWMYGRRFAATRRYFSRLDADFPQRVEGFIAEHLALETRTSPIAIGAYVQPTARAFGYVFAQMASLPGLTLHRSLLHEIGECIGAAIIAFDCAADRDRDRRRGDFNPLGDGPDAVQDALAFSRDQLLLARQACLTAFGPNALTVQALDGVSDRVMKVGRRLACPRCATQMHQALQGWGLAARPGAIQFNSLLGLGGLAALTLGLVARLMAGVPPEMPPSAGIQQPPPNAPPPTIPGALNPNVPIPTGTPPSGGDCSSTASCCDGTQCCFETSSCALDNACDSANCSGLDCGGCDGCGGCDCSC